MYFARSSFWNIVPIARGDVVAVPGERDLLPRRVGGHLLERLAADEVVVELDERPVAELVRRQVVVLDVVGVVSCRRASRCPRSPFAGSHSRYAFMSSPVKIAGSGHGIQPDSSVLVAYTREPTCRRPNSSPASTIAALTSSPSSHGPKSSSPGTPGHAVVQRAHLAAGDRDLAHVEELDLGQRAAGDLLQHLERGRALDLEAVEPCGRSGSPPSARRARTSTS